MAVSTLPTLCLTIKASGTIAANRFVTPLGAQAGAGANSIGVTRVAAVANDFIPVDALGTAAVTAGGTVAIGDTLKSDADGKAILWATSGAKIAIALSAGASGDLIEALLIPNVA